MKERRMPQSIEEQVLAFAVEQIKVRTKAADMEITADSVLTDLGLQSIEAVLLSGEIEDQFQVEIDPADIFAHDTLGAFVREIAGRIEA